MTHPDFADSDIRSIRKLGFAGAAMPEGLLTRVDAASGPELFVNHYGSSEIYTFTVEQHAARKPGSAGKAGINQRIRVVSLAAETTEVLAGTSEAEFSRKMMRGSRQLPSGQPAAR